MAAFVWPVVVDVVVTVYVVVIVAVAVAVAVVVVRHVLNIFSSSSSSIFFSSSLRSQSSLRVSHSVGRWILAERRLLVLVFCSTRACH